jgi:hypothetical protein
MFRDETLMSETQLRSAVFFRDFDNFTEDKTEWKGTKVEIVVQNKPDDLLTGDEFGYFHLATTDVFVVIRELSPEFVGSAFNFF